MPTVKFTDMYINKLKPLETGQLDVMDSFQFPYSGRLGLKVSKRTKSLFIQYAVEGKRRKYTLGKLPKDYYASKIHDTAFLN